MNDSTIQEIDSSVWGFIKCTTTNCKYVEIIAYMSVFGFVGFLLLTAIICCLLCKLIYQRKKFNYENHQLDRKYKRKELFNDIEMNDIIDGHAYKTPMQKENYQKYQERPSNIPKNSVPVLPKMTKSPRSTASSETDY